MSDEVLTYILISFLVVFMVALSIYFLPAIKKGVKKITPKKKAKKKKQPAEKTEKVKRPILLTPQESKKSEKPLEIEYGKEATKKVETKKEEDDLVMNYPPLVAQSKNNYGNRTVINSNKNFGNEFDEIKNFLQENEEDLFTNVGRNALNNRSTTSKSAPPPPITPRTSTIYNADNSFKQEYPEFVAGKSPSFNYSKPKEYTPRGGSVLDLGKDEKDIIRQFKNLSPEMKKLLISDVLSKRKSDDF